MDHLRTFLIILASCLFLPAEAANGQDTKDIKYINDSLLHVLDKAVADSKALREQRDERINTLQAAYNSVSSWSVRYDIAQQLYLLTNTYKTDLALHYLHLSLNAAERLRDIDKADKCKCQLMKQYARTGFFGEAVLTMNEINPRTLNAKNRIAYYDCTSYMYNQLAFYTKDKTDQDRFRRLEKAMKDSLLRITPPDSMIWLIYMQGVYSEAGKYREALRALDKWARLTRPGEHDYAIVEYYRYQIYDAMGLNDEALHHLLLSAINDVTTVTYDEAAIFYLCRILRDRGDIDRARSYVKYAYEASTTFGGKMKDWATQDIESINSKFQNTLQGHNRMMLVISVLLSLLLLVVIILAIILLKQHHKLHDYARRQKENNKALTEANRQLQLSIEANKETNRHLYEANVVKENCIATFFALCTHYIESVNHLRNRISKLLRARKFDELSDMARSSEEEETALQELYGQFDHMFLAIYPTFVQEFNELLTPENRIAEPRKNTLTTPLRIFALIRLGIDDSGKISQLLNLANSTVYNYRTRFRNHAAGDRSTFEEQVRNIGNHQP
jgi:tetratricopeptide (TPR) repeat protein